jgi:hypothetical protein
MRPSDLKFVTRTLDRASYNIWMHLDRFYSRIQLGIATKKINWSLLYSNRQTKEMT